MSGILLTQYNGAILGPIAKVLGALLNVIFNIVPNVGVAIIIFTAFLIEIIGRRRDHHLPLSAASYLSAAEIQQAVCQNESRDQGRSGKVQGQKRSGIHDQTERGDAVYL